MIESYVNRHQVVPGMTGLAQVSGLRGATSEAGSAEARVIADIHYIRNWSLWLDLSILTQTTWAVITGKNAH
jgi:lipopolysaccharide/colanic/teichoic acid biosynthesis glycosyltransferase